MLYEEFVMNADVQVLHAYLLYMCSSVCDDVLY